ncbi:MAG TPA: tetrathionate reductase family octaheme c-type cytochrome [Polyangiaceae bacterium]|nr:tetrathionate reductase family octaheme c-type cytochrome [Polyangiaceae bacterium]
MSVLTTLRHYALAFSGPFAVLAAIAGTVAAAHREERRDQAPGFRERPRAHFDHTPVIPAHFASPQAVTRKCLECHPDAAAVMKTSHWLWLGPESKIAGREGKQRIGKKNVLNNFCISTRGNERACTKCHAGYGWEDASFDFSKTENVDCLVCHEHSGVYVKGTAGLPTKDSDLAIAARSVGMPSRENCLGCHAYGGGGQAVKHGDLDSSLLHPFADQDVHLGKHRLDCIDCHRAPKHQLRGRAFSVSAEDSNGVRCNDCHANVRHRDTRIEAHLASLACQSCHVPNFARTVPTKATWDWSQAGDGQRRDDPHHYLKIKGEFTYEQDVVPEYRWFNLTVARYLAADPIAKAGVTTLNAPQGDVRDRSARIWPFKVHRARQPYDAVNGYLLQPVTGGEGGYWTTFDWNSAFELGARATGVPYSGQFGFADTEMYWPITHMVAPKEQALGCTSCHGPAARRMDWMALGYAGDPIKTGARR